MTEVIQPPPLTLPMRMSSELNELATALSTCQGELVNPTANVQSGANYKYAGLDQILDVVRPLRKKHGLSMFQAPEIHGDRTVLASMLMHKSGQYLCGLIEITGDDTRGKSSDQAIGSSISYMRKYCELAAMGLFPQGEDKDGVASAAATTAVQQSVPTMLAVVERAAERFVEAYGDHAEGFIAEQGVKLDELKDLGPVVQAEFYAAIVAQGLHWADMGPDVPEVKAPAKRKKPKSKEEVLK